MKSISQEIKGLLALMGVVGSLAVPMWKSFAAPLPKSTLVSSTPAKSQRAPASAPLSAAGDSIQNSNLKLVKSTPSKASAGSVSELESKSAVLNLDCRENQEIVVDARYLRLKSSRFNCLQESLRDLSLMNQANGFTGSVIFHQNGLTTDYIDLKEGVNNIKFTAKTSNGESFSKTVKILRRSIASVPQD